MNCFRKPFVTAHAGCMNTSKNTVDSIIEGIKHGADIVEIDVNITNDGVPILFHDKSITLEGKTVPIQQMKYNELKSHKGNLIKLNNALEIISENGKIANIDIKALDAFKVIVDTVVSCNMAHDVFFTGCNADTAYRIKTYSPRIQVLLNAEMEENNIGDIKKNKSKKNTVLSSVCNKAISSYCCGLNVNYQNCEEELVEYAHRQCLSIFIWTLDDINHMKKFIEMGVDSITTNEVKKLKGLLAYGRK